uniref:Uncharacterized protein n=1 Tax=Rhizophagus irregularis (strain DAOM 181602 / DAOM 197198 / MUCL 43194) TaxID=747089 RepID=U9U171_RHIID
METLLNIVHIVNLLLKNHGLKIHWNAFKEYGLTLYGITKDPETKEFMMIIQFIDKEIYFHSENILQADEDISYISDFELSGLANEQRSDDKSYVVEFAYKCMNSNSIERPPAKD